LIFALKQYFSSDQKIVYLAFCWTLWCEMLKLILFQNKQIISKSYWKDKQESLFLPLLWHFICPTDGHITKFSLHASAAHFLSFEKRSRIERESIEIPVSTLKHRNVGVRTNFWSSWGIEIYCSCSRNVIRAELIQERCSFVRKHMFRIKRFQVDIWRTAYTLN
jgi:hypothetical protein